MINKFSINSVANFIYLSFIYLVLMFDRSFSGIYFRGYRIGEYMVAIGVICVFTILILAFRYKSLSINNRITFALVLLISSFIYLIFARGDSFDTPYIYKAS